MKIQEIYIYDENLTDEFIPLEIIEENIRDMDEVMRSLIVVKPEIMSDYIEAVSKRLKKDIQDYQIHLGFIDFKEINEKYPALKDYRELQELIIILTSKFISLPENISDGKEKIKRSAIEKTKAFTVVQYHRTKAFADMFGKEEGIKFWKKLVDHIMAEWLKSTPEHRKGSMKEFMENSIKGFSESNAFDLTAVVFDDDRFLMKFDRCIVHESTKHLDQEFAYLSYCYMGDISDAKSKGFRRKRRRRTQTLHLGKFCDEFFWDDVVYPDAKHPELKLMERLGKDNPSEILKEYN